MHEYSALIAFETDCRIHLLVESGIQCVRASSEPPEKVVRLHLKRSRPTNLLTTCFRLFLSTSCWRKACRQLAKWTAYHFASCRQALNQQIVDEKRRKQLVNKLCIELLSIAIRQLVLDVLSCDHCLKSDYFEH
ncbi:hypothetical protein Y032_0211g2218 [Ancylostoma ceylanicum]|uniref:Uncharacterized protein n=1 Tax=Ancylostoma ceylanicum TaxID=53326 RepID=A0A016SLB1_9BILA|nr:hypothetical protein Y032_0211g2218 [Ancylostoma ceylanicum]